MAIRPCPGAIVPASTCISVDLPAPLLADQTNTFATLDAEIDTVGRTDGTETLFNTFQFNNLRAFCHHEIRHSLTTRMANQR
jgi:hypothetical protein